MSLCVRPRVGVCVCCTCGCVSEGGEKGRGARPEAPQSRGRHSFSRWGPVVLGITQGFLLYPVVPSHRIPTAGRLGCGSTDLPTLTHVRREPLCSGEARFQDFARLWGRHGIKGQNVFYPPLFSRYPECRSKLELQVGFEQHGPSLNSRGTTSKRLLEPHGLTSSGVGVQRRREDLHVS